jgi:hypothetical protein
MIRLVFPIPEFDGFQRRIILQLALMMVALFAIPSASAGDFGAGQGTVPFWISVRSPHQIDPQVERLLSGRAAFVALRFADRAEATASQRTSLVNRLKAALDRPILVYSWASRSLSTRDTGSEAMGWLEKNPELQLTDAYGRKMAAYGDVRDKRYRALTAKNIGLIVNRYDADGVALDLAIRTPTPRPVRIAKRCIEEPEFCESYAAGMDTLFGDLRTQLGPAKKILYNGLWHFREDMIQDQIRLLDAADAVIVEYFGFRPSENLGAFAEDIAPYLSVMGSLKDNKRIYIYGRGLWSYETYVQDYLRQRYLFAAYLLAANANTAFKYHSSFQLPAHAGRSGALDLYADWFVPIGSPSEDRKSESGVFSRRFTKGLVLVLPDDQGPTSYFVDGSMYSPEGKVYTGKVSLSPGTGLLLLNDPPASLGQVRIDLQSVSDWPNARWVSDENIGSFLALTATAHLSFGGGQDLLLDSVRVLKPRNALELNVRPSDSGARIILIAEIDDSNQQHRFAAVCLPSNEDRKCSTETDFPYYRMPLVPGQQRLPAVSPHVLTPGRWEQVSLNGDDLFQNPPYSFRRWAYARIEGNMHVSSVFLKEYRGR